MKALVTWGNDVAEEVRVSFIAVSKISNPIVVFVVVHITLKVRF